MAGLISKVSYCVMSLNTKTCLNMYSIAYKILFKMFSVRALFDIINSIH